jgi:triphosphatase
MPLPREIELKLEVPADELHSMERIALRHANGQQAKSPGRERQHVISTYYDTEKLKLRQRGLSLRVRRIGSRRLQTIKRSRPGDGTALDRDEWESEITSDAPDFGAARGTALEPWLSKKVRRGLRPVFETRVTRRVYPVRRGDSEIELSFDVGRIDAGKKSAQLCEVELELKRGQLSELFQLARRLTKQTPAALSVQSKAERGYELVTGESLGAVKAAPVRLSPDQSTADSFKSVARACLHQLVANVPPLRNRDAEAVHQSRVSLRRLRAAISLFAELLDGTETDSIKSQLKSLSREFAPAREIDVFMKRVVEPIAKRDGAEKGIGRLKRELRTNRKHAFARARLVLATDRFRKLVFDTAGWVECGDWTTPDDGAKRALGERPIAETAAEQLDRRFKKIRKRGKGFAKLDPQRRHKLRIAAKKLRYAADFFSAVFPGKRATRRRGKFVDALKRWQDCLGDLNDIAVNEKASAQLAARANRGFNKSNGRKWKAFAAGRLSGREEARVASVLKSAVRAYQQFAKAKPYWN